MLDPKLVAQRAIDGLPPAVPRVPSSTETTFLLADELLRYAAGTVSIEVPLRDPDGLVAMLCEDLEASHLMAEFLSPEGAEERPRRVLEIGTGWGFPGLVLSRMYPHAQVDVLEPNLRRAWFLRRLINLISTRNLRVHVDHVANLQAQVGPTYDLVLIKHLPVATAVLQGAPFLRPGGTLALWAGNQPDESALQKSAREVRLVVAPPRTFHSNLLTGHALMLARRPDEPKPVTVEAKADADEDTVSV